APSRKDSARHWMLFDRRRTRLYRVVFGSGQDFSISDSRGPFFMRLRPPVAALRWTDRVDLAELVSLQNRAMNCGPHPHRWRFLAWNRFCYVLSLKPPPATVH